jgi:hypothetical protein
VDRWTRFGDAFQAQVADDFITAINDQNIIELRHTYIGQFRADDFVSF